MNKTSNYDQLHYGTEAATPRNATVPATRQGQLSDRVISIRRPSARSAQFQVTMSAYADTLHYANLTIFYHALVDQHWFKKEN